MRECNQNLPKNNRQNTEVFHPCYQVRLGPSKIWWTLSRKVLSDLVLKAKEKWIKLKNICKEEALGRGLFHHRSIRYRHIRLISWFKEHNWQWLRIVAPRNLKTIISYRERSRIWIKWNSFWTSMTREGLPRPLKHKRFQQGQRVDLERKQMIK